MRLLPFSRFLRISCACRILLFRRLLQIFDISRLLRAFLFRIQGINHLLHLRIAHPLVHPDHALDDPVIRDFTVWIERHECRKCQAVLPCVQGTDAVGEPFRKHRDHPVSQIYRGAAKQGFPVECRVLLDIIGDIRNMNAQFVPLSDPFDRHGVIEVLRVRPVDRDRAEPAQILSPGKISRKHMIRDPLRL